MIQHRVKCYYKVGSLLIVIIFIFSGLFNISLFDNKLSNVQAASTWTQASDNEFENGAMDNVTIYGNGNEAELIIDLPGVHKWTKKTPASRPPYRYNLELETIYNTDKVMFFGGWSSASGHLNDTWVYDLSDNNWTNMKPINSPSPRQNHYLASVYGTDKIVLYYGGAGIFYLETWVYDLSENSWTMRSPVANPGFKNYSAMTSIYGYDKVLLYGGWMTHDETWVYDLSEDNWKRMYPRTNLGGRSHIEMSPIYGTDKVLLFGGYSNLDDTWVYDLSDNNWTKMSPTIKPGGRYFHSMSPIHGSDNVIMFGGFGVNCNTWVYDLSKDEWTKIVLENNTSKPPFGFQHGLASINGTNQVVFYGAYSRETWVYDHDLSFRNGTYTSIPFDTNATSAFYKLHWNKCTLPETNIKLQLRSAVNESLLNSQDFVGPDGTTGSFYNITPSQIWSGHTGDRWMQYKVFFTMNKYTDSPSFEDITIEYNCLPTTNAISPLNGSLMTNNKPTFKWTFYDFDSEYQNAFQVLIDDNINFTSINYNSGEQNKSVQNWEFQLGTNYTALPDGTWYWKVRSCDEDGIWTEYTSPRMLIIDTQTPTSVINIPLHNGFYNSLNTISVTAIDQTNGSGVIKVEIMIKRLNDNLYWDGLKWTQFPIWLITTGTNEWSYDSSSVQWTSGNGYSVQSRATDSGNLIETPQNGNIFTIDTDKPISIVDIPLDNTWVNSLDIISGHSVDTGGSGITNVEISIRKADTNIYWDGTRWKANEVWLKVNGTMDWNYNSNDIQWSTGEQYYIDSQAYDKAGNIEQHSQRSGISVWYDNTIPGPNSIYINNGDEYTNDPATMLSIQAEDKGAGISEMSFSINGIDWSDWEPFNVTKKFELPNDDGKNSVYLRVRDYANNVAEPVLDTIILDSTPPQDLTIEIDNNTEFTNSNIVSLNLSAVDSLSGLNEISFSTDGIIWTTWEPFSPIKLFYLQISDGKKIIFFRVNDKAGNIASPISDSIIFDTTPPHSLSITINGGVTEIKSTQVFIELNAEDTLSGVDKISLGKDNKTWDKWEDYTKNKYYILSSGDGIKTVYFRAKDRAGNIAQAISVTIRLNTTTPNLNLPEKSSSDEEVSYVPIILILILITFISIGFLIVIKHNEKFEQKLLLPEAVTVKPSPISDKMLISGQMPTISKPEILPSTTSTTTVQQPTISTTPTPMLEKTSTISDIKSPTSSPTLSELPQLPPAQNADTKSVTEELTPKSDTKTPTLAPSPPQTPVQNQSGTPDIAKSPELAPKPQLQEQVAKLQKSENENST